MGLKRLDLSNSKLSEDERLAFSSDSSEKAIDFVENVRTSIRLSRRLRDSQDYLKMSTDDFMTRTQQSEDDVIKEN